jgi:hypothetical protein
MKPEELVELVDLQQEIAKGFAAKLNKVAAELDSTKVKLSKAEKTASELTDKLSEAEKSAAEKPEQQKVTFTKEKIASAVGALVNAGLLSESLRGATTGKIASDPDSALDLLIGVAEGNAADGTFGESNTPKSPNKTAGNRRVSDADQYLYDTYKAH